MKVSIKVGEEEIAKMVEEYIKDKLELGADMKLVTAYPASHMYEFSDEEEVKGDASEEHQ